ncbi:MAG: metallophosphoesterase family protein [Candidatus Omnitrophica bacterium]|nr:metallophosphoesterase family protein [Candidatus Omnitrophota bacterium]
MRIAVLSDIHGNLEALEATLQDVRLKVCDRIVCLGDVVGYGANPQECVDLVRSVVWTDETGEYVVKGNHDDAASGGDDSYFNRDAQRAVRWTKDQLDPDSRRWLSQLPMDLRMEDRVYLVHSSPLEPRHWNYVVSMPDAYIAFQHFTEQICFIGHSHVPFHVAKHRYEDEVLVEPDNSLKILDEYRYLSNVGSVGQPRDGDARASYVVVDLAQNTLDRYRVDYDRDLAAEKIRNAGLPEFLADRILRGR